MTKNLQRTPRVLMTLSALLPLLLGASVSFAQHGAALARFFAVHAAESPGIQEPNRPLVKILLTGVVERDQKQIAIEKAGPVKPGEIVKFTMNSVNEGSAPARDYRAIGQIPKGTSFVTNSAEGDRNTRVSYSIDNGKQFYAQPMIDERQTDGTIKRVVAPTSMYTQVRFEWADPLAAGGRLVTSYQVRVK